MKKAAIAVEPRKMFTLVHVIRNHMKHLGNTWDFYIACSKNTYDTYYSKLIPNLKHIDGIVESENLSALEYNTILATYEFWETVESFCDKCLIFQYDTWMLHGDIEQFMEYDYLGAPWWDCWYGGNGGFSLRTSRVMKEITNRWNIRETWKPNYEDFARRDFFLEDVHYFCKLVPFVGNLAPRNINEFFCFEYAYTKPTMAIHKSHLDRYETNGLLFDDILKTEKNTTEFEFAYNNLCKGKKDNLGYSPGDIYEHLPIIREYAAKCKHITEFGTRWFVSTYALAMGNPDRLVSYDIMNAEESHRIFQELLLKSNTNIRFDYLIKNVLEEEIEETDLLLIDTEHNYLHLRKELEKHAHLVKKYIILHDTELFGYKDSNEYGTAEYLSNLEDREFKQGLVPAMQEFLEINKNWMIDLHLSNCNGLTILKNTKYT